MRIEYDGIEFDKNLIKSVSYKSDVVNTSYVSVGGAVAAQLTFTIGDGDEQFLNYNFNSSTITYFDDNDELKATMKVKSCKRKGNLINFICQDNMTKFDKKMKGYKFPTQCSILIEKICAQCDMLIDSLDIINDVRISSNKGLKGKSCREVLKSLAALQGGFITISPEGKLQLKSFEQKSVKITYKDDLKGQTNELKDFATGAVIYRKDEKQYTSGDETSNNIYIENNLILQKMSSSKIKDALNYVFDKVMSFEFLPGEFKIRNNSDINVGDIITYEDKHGNYHNVYVMSLIIQNNTTMTIKCYASKDNTSTSSSSSSNGDASDDTTYMYHLQNDEEIGIEGDSRTINRVVIDCDDEAKIFYNASLNFTLDEATDMIFTINLNGSPIQTIYHRGREGNNTFHYSSMIKFDEGDCYYDLDCDTNLVVAKGDFNLSLIFQNAFIEEIEEVEEVLVAQWDISKNQDNSVMAMLYDSGTLRYTGEGETYSYYDVDYLPFYDYLPQITRAEVVGALTTIGSHIFSLPYCTEFVCTSNTINYVREYAFYENTCPTINLNVNNATFEERSLYKAKNTNFKIVGDIANIESFLMGTSSYAGTNNIELFEVEGHVTNVSSSAFQGHNIKKFQATSVGTIGKYAFANLTNFECTCGSIEILGEYAFQNTTFANPEFYTTKVNEIGAYVFKNSNITKFTINEAETKTIHDYAFYNNATLKEVSIYRGNMSGFDEETYVGVEAINGSVIESFDTNLYMCPVSNYAFQCDTLKLFSCAYVKDVGTQAFAYTPIENFNGYATGDIASLAFVESTIPRLNIKTPATIKANDVFHKWTKSQIVSISGEIEGRDLITQPTVIDASEEEA